ncbi:hypothetical protein Bca4012_042118 [Brassica carinata]
MKRGFMGSSKKEPADSRMIRKSTREMESEHDLVATTIKACFIRIPTKRIRTGLGGGNHQGSIHLNSWI